MSKKIKKHVPTSGSDGDRIEIQALHSSSDLLLKLAATLDAIDAESSKNDRFQTLERLACSTAYQIIFKINGGSWNKASQTVSRKIQKNSGQLGPIISQMANRLADAEEGE